jgi:hypothetical protein
MDDRTIALLFLAMAAVSGFIAVTDRGTYRLIWAMITLTWFFSALVWMR